jgi:hypothetical protein
MADFLIECLVSGITFFIIAYVFLSFFDSKFGKALGTPTFLLIFLVLPVVCSVFLGTSVAASLPDSTSALIGLVFVMPAIAFLVGVLRSRRR